MRLFLLIFSISSAVGCIWGNQALANTRLLQSLEVVRDDQDGEMAVIPAGVEVVVTKIKPGATGDYIFIKRQDTGEEFWYKSHQERAFKINYTPFAKTPFDNQGPDGVPKIDPDSNKKWSPNCLEFVDELGQLGPYGQTIVSSLSEHLHPAMFDPENLSSAENYCPNYSKFNSKQKKYFWVYALAAMSQKESTCRAKPPRKQGPNGLLAGILQLHYKKTHLYIDGEIKTTEGNYCKTPKGNSIDAENPHKALACGITMLNEQVEELKDLFVKSGSYWQVLMSGKKKTKKLLADFTPCHDPDFIPDGALSDTI